jgi:hypothetical protein
MQRRIVDAFSSRLPLKSAALFFALVLWFVVAAEEPAARELDVRLAITSDSLVRIAGPLPRVHALIVGSGRDLLKLYATPPTIRRHFGDDSPETIVLEVRPSDVDLPTGVSVRVQDVHPRSIPLRLDVRASRHVPVRSALRVVVPAGMRMSGAVRFEPESVRVTGPRTRVMGVDSVVTMRRELQSGNGMDRVPLDTAGLGVQVSPVHVQATAPIARAETQPRDTARARPDTTVPADSTRRPPDDSASSGDGKEEPPRPPGRP